MREVVIAVSEAEKTLEGDPLLEVINSIREIGKQDTRMYRTSCSFEGIEYSLVTASKEVHLFLGVLPLDGQRNLCKLMQSECENGNCFELLVKIHSNDIKPSVAKGRHDVLHVAMIQRLENRVTFILSTPR